MGAKAAVVDLNEHASRARIERIRSLFEKSHRTRQETLESDLEIGRELTEQKAELSHGQWIPWVKMNLPFGIDQAGKYMRLFERRDEVSNSYSNTNLTDYTIDNACRLLSKRETKPSLNKPEVKEPERTDRAIEILNDGNGHTDAEVKQAFGLSEIARCKERLALARYAHLEKHGDGLNYLEVDEPYRDVIRDPDFAHELHENITAEPSAAELVGPFAKALISLSDLERRQVFVLLGEALSSLPLRERQSLVRYFVHGSSVRTTGGLGLDVADFLYGMQMNFGGKVRPRNVNK